jgi:hypothetical protein
LLEWTVLLALLIVAIAGGVALFRSMGPSALPLSHQEITPDPAWVGQPDFQLRLDASFEFQLAKASSDEGCLFKVSVDGKAEYLELNRTRGWSRTTFSVSRHDLDHLVSRINAWRVFGLAKSYRDVVISEPTCVAFLIKANGRQKAVACYDCFPSEVLDLFSFVRGYLMRNAIGAKTVTITDEQARESYRELESSVR